MLFVVTGTDGSEVTGAGEVLLAVDPDELDVLPGMRIGGIVLEACWFCFPSLGKPDVASGKACSLRFSAAIKHGKLLIKIQRNGSMLTVYAVDIHLQPIFEIDVTHRCGKVTPISFF
jgi:hypothetical protein